jgi:hypothetical protein
MHEEVLKNEWPEILSAISVLPFFINGLCSFLLRDQMNQANR